MQPSNLSNQADQPNNLFSEDQTNQPTTESNLPSKDQTNQPTTENDLPLEDQTNQPITESNDQQSNICTCNVKWQQGAITFRQFEDYSEQASMTSKSGILPIIQIDNKNDCIQLWKKNSIVKLCVRTDQMESIDGLGKIRQGVKMAAYKWNKQIKNVQFLVVDVGVKAAYEVVYNKEPKPNLEAMYADCQYPNDELSKLNLYPCFAKQSFSNQVTILTHQLGHALGFYHGYHAKHGESYGIMGFGRPGNPPRMTYDDKMAACYIYGVNHTYIADYNKKRVKVNRIIPYG